VVLKNELCCRAGGYGRFQKFLNLTNDGKISKVHAFKSATIEIQTLVNPIANDSICKERWWHEPTSRVPSDSHTLSIFEKKWGVKGTTNYRLITRKKE
jgi:hypothetical protein